MRPQNPLSRVASGTVKTSNPVSDLVSVFGIVVDPYLEPPTGLLLT